MKPKTRGRPRYDETDNSATETFLKMAADGLDRSESIALWVQLKNRILDAIDAQTLLPQSRLPSEQAICDIFDVSKPVVRAALSALAADGHVIKMPRKGMFIAPTRRDVDFMTSNLGVFGDLTAKGHLVTVKTFEFYRDAPSDIEQQVFGLPREGSVVRITRVYYSDGKPITLTHISLPGHKVPGMEKLDIDNRSVFQTIKEQYGLTVKRAERWFTAAMPDAEATERMGVAANTPLISIESIAYDYEGGPLEYYRAFYNSAVASIHVRVES
ncbi:GntR family transcriptional regulator [Rhizobium sp. Leaf306]|uniref:GntR family transcriptional regulator n=1 Tax=Rhizobium sp. Leaf306 TaxID=1736330 RepID=UPI00071547D4|nr:GntR family transcriptional regulator [Rhizobium sp. Leaf306]KQQ35556.1 GntR family transcriptional regulator [Rhizobium sp. Leaf306]